MKALFCCIVALGALAACTSGAGVPAPGPPPSTAAAAASVSPFTVALTATAAPTVALPVGGGFSGALAIGGMLQPSAQVTTTLQNTAPSSAPALSSRRVTSSARATLDAAVGQAIVYIGLNFDQRTPGLGTFTPPATFPPTDPTDPPPAPITLTIALPTAVQVPGAAYYLAFFDPLRPSLGWQLGFEGPVASGSTLTFTGSAATFFAYQQYWLAVYVATPGSTPTVAPATSPMPTPVPTANILTNLQNQMGPDTICSGSPCAAGSPGPGQTDQPPAIYAIATGVQNASFSGSTTRLTVTASSANHADTLFYMPGQPFLSPLATNFTFDFQFMLDQPLVDPQKPTQPVGPVEALEFDTNINLPGFTYNFSSQCVIKTGNTWMWQIWGYTTPGSPAQNWIDSGITCLPALFYPGVHHIIWTYSVNPYLLQKKYLVLSIDGTQYVPAQSAAVGQGDTRSGQKTNLEAQFQIDTRPYSGPSPAFNEWVGNVTLTYQ